MGFFPGHLLLLIKKKKNLEVKMSGEKVEMNTKGKKAWMGEWMRE